MKQLPIVRLMVILSLLNAKEKKSGYQMFKKNPFSHQGLYKELRTLKKSGAVTGEAISQTGKPDKILYEICNRDILMEHVDEALHQHVDINSVRTIDIDVVLSFRPYISDVKICNWLKKFPVEANKHKQQKWETDITLNKDSRIAMLNLIRDKIELIEKGKA